LAGQGVGAPTEFIGVQDVFTETGKYDGLLQTYGLDAKAVAEAAKRAIGRK
jgi:transketolase C-terminal domain/subunit